MTMTLIAGKTKQLALLGGTPVAPDLAKECPAWPPADPVTAKALGELYLSRNWSFNGPVEQDFAAKWAAFHTAKHGICMVNGTVTLEGALAALGVGRGDEVIVPALTWIATAMAANYLGAKVVFVDIEPTTFCLDPVKVEAAITPRTRAIIPVHLYGSMADMDAITRIARKHKLAVIEDCAHGHGGMWGSQGLGSIGDVGSFSFQQSKTVASGEGGICLTNRADLADALYRFKHIGYAPGTTQGKATQGPPAGLACHNYRATEFQALILRGQFRNFPRLITKYNANADRLHARLAGVDGVRAQAKGRRATRQNYYSFATIWDDPKIADIPIGRIQKALAAEGLATGGTYGPVYSHLLFNLAKSDYRLPAGGCPVADGIARDRVALFSHVWLGAPRAAVDRIGEIIAKVAANAYALRAVQN